MGLDINFNVLNPKKFYQKAEEYGFYEIHEIGMSRTFCNLLCREDVIEHKDELTQIGELLNVDITPIKAMTWYCDQYDLKSQLGLYETEEEKQAFINQVNATNKKVIGNIDKVKSTVILLLEGLSSIENLSEKLLPTSRDTLNIPKYFSNFNEDVGDGYIGNNFGQDLRILLKFIDFAASIGEKTVFFSFN